MKGSTVLSFADLLNLPSKPHRIYEKPPLALAVCQIRFAKNLSVADPKFVANFQRAIQDDYPLTDEQDHMSVQIGVGMGEAGVLAGRSGQWTFHDIDDMWTLVLAQDFIALETRRYEEFTVFMGRLRRILAALIKHIQPTVVTRIGLRYINEFRGDADNWGCYMKPQFMGLLGTSEFAPFAKLGLQEVRFEFPDGEQGLSVKHGLLPTGSTVRQLQGEEVHDDPFYLLDIDLSRTYKPPKLPKLVPDEVCDQIDVYNQTAYQLFHTLVRTEYTDQLKERDNDAP